MNEPTINCPHCQREIKLTESLAAPVLAAAKRELEQRLAQKEQEFGNRESRLQQQEAALKQAAETQEALVAEKLKAERAKIGAEEARKARQTLSTEMEERDKAIGELRELVKTRETKLAEAQKVQSDLLKKERALDDAKRELDLTVEKRIQESLAATRQQGRQEAEDELKLKVAEKEQLIAGMQKTIEDLKRRSEQGSQQLQGEVQELQLEALLRAKFPRDTIEPVEKGEFGGDALQHVNGPLGQRCGSILWESKRTKNWSPGWLPKLRSDQRTAKAEIAVLVTQVLPPEVASFDLIDGVWVIPPAVALPVAVMLRQSLLEVAMSRVAAEGQQSKMEMIYGYLTGPRFRQRVQAIVEAFSSMKEDLDKEKKAITRQWAKRDEQIERVMQATVGMYGDMQGIAGKTLLEIEGLELKSLGEGELL